MENITKDAGHNTLVADILNKDITRPVFREVWRKYLDEVFVGEKQSDRPLLMGHVTEEPWQLIVYPSSADREERNHAAVMSLTFIEHNKMLDSIEDEKLLDAVMEIAADRIVQIGAAALEDVISETNWHDAAYTKDCTIEIWFSNDGRRGKIDRDSTIFSPSTEI